MDGTDLISAFDALLADLDGVVYAGPRAIPGAVESLRRLAGIGVGLGYVTNNASRTPAEVAQHLRELGAPAEDYQVVSSPQAAGELLASLLPAGARVLITGGDALAREIERAGLFPVHSEAEDPVAVVQGFHPDLGWKDLAEASFVVAGGALWVATNTDMSIPQARGIAPGNGTLVAAVAAATGQTPLVAGKPEAPLFHAAAKRLAADRPLVVGADAAREQQLRAAVELLDFGPGLAGPHDGGVPCVELQDGLRGGVFRAAAHRPGVGPGTEEETDRGDHHGLAGTGFTGHHAQARA